MCKSLLFTATLCIILFFAQDSSRAESVERRKSIGRVLIFTASTNFRHENFARFNKSLQTNNLDLIELGANEQWKQDKDGGFRTVRGGFRKIDLFKKAIKTYKNEQDLVIIWFDDGLNSIVNSGRKQILNRFFNFNSKIVFAANVKCRPSRKLAIRYPANKGKGYKYLDSSSFIGYASDIWKLLENYQDGESQRFYTEMYLDVTMRQSLSLRIDHTTELFQTLQETSKKDLDLDLVSVPDEARIWNVAHGTEPLLVSLSKSENDSSRARALLNSLGNYLARAWTLNGGCRHCNESQLSLPNQKELPSVLIGIFIEEATPFLEDFFDNILLLNYPKDKTHLFIHNRVAYHSRQVDEFVNQTRAYYANITVDELTKEEHSARGLGLDLSRELNLRYYLALDAISRLDEPDTLRALIEANKPIVAPLLTRPNKLWSNFWGALNEFDYYSRSFDYLELIKRERLGIWNVPHIMNAYLIDNKRFPKLDDNHYIEPALAKMKPEHAFARKLRAANVNMYMLNSLDFGHLVDTTSYNTSLEHPDFYQLKDNMLDWELKYLHDNYSQVLEDQWKLEQPCQDVFWFPLVNELFCQQLIEIMESFGRWSGGTNHDPRIEGGYESVPTRDIHMRQVGLHDLWLLFLREYVMPIQLKEYIGYEHNPPRADLAFVVRYHPQEQDSLVAHHDSSTYTMNVALNEPGRDYLGGGCRFVRYNCSVTDSRRGWALLHPGRLTHYHEGLKVTNGTRYILVTFVDP